MWNSILRGCLRWPRGPAKQLPGCERRSRHRRTSTSPEHTLPVSVLATIALSVLLGLLVIVLHWADSHGPDSTAADLKTTNT